MNVAKLFTDIAYDFKFHEMEVTEGLFPLLTAAMYSLLLYFKKNQLDTY